jgi:hypothetical protein
MVKVATLVVTLEVVYLILADCMYIYINTRDGQETW